MTKRMFQVSRLLAIGMTVFVCLNLLLDTKVMMMDDNIIGRCFMQILVLVVFWIVSVLYERKRKIFSTGYVFLLINVFINGTICPCYFTESRLDAGTREGVIQPPDFYSLYLTVYFLIMLVVWIYLLAVKHTTQEIKQADFIRYSHTDDIAVFLMGILVFLLNFKFGSTGAVMYVPVLGYFAIRLFYTTGKTNIYTILALLAGLYCIYRLRTSRYMIVAYIMPIILIFCIYVAVNDSKKRGKKVVPLILVGVFAVLAYGMVSELVKLNLYWGRSYNILYEITNFKSIVDACARQIYRLFGIWTELGGNIIQHVKLNGYYYGLSFVKSFAGYFGFEYVNLPLISAEYISAAYAQPGLIAEGYANFGVIGAVINMLIPFALAEGALTWFLKARDPLALCILTVPFTKILLDGGTFNNIFFGIATCIFAFALYIVLHFFKMELHGYGNVRFRIIRKKRIENES